VDDRADIKVNSTDPYKDRISSDLVQKWTLIYKTEHIKDEGISTQVCKGHSTPQIRTTHAIQNGYIYSHNDMDWHKNSYGTRELVDVSLG